MHIRPPFLAILCLTAGLGAQQRPRALSACPEGEKPIPRTSADAAVLEFDFPGMLIGTAEYEGGPTGATVFHFPNRVMAAVDVRGGAPGTVETDALRTGSEVAFVDAITFAGGSAYGLAAAAGVSAELHMRGRQSGRWQDIAVVPGAIIFDLGGRRLNGVIPDEELGRAALRAERPGRFPIGAEGAGRFAMQGWYFDDPQYSGQGGAFRQIGPTKIAVFTVVNALGSIVGRDGRVVRCTLEEGASSCPLASERFARRLETPGGGTSGSGAAGGFTTNTTITLVVTNQKLSVYDLQRLAIQVHSSMARAIQPFSTAFDGDALFAVTTGEVDNPNLPAMTLGVAAGEVAWDAILRSVPKLDPKPAENGTTPDRAALQAMTGRYAFSALASWTVALDGTRLLVKPEGNQDSYLLAAGKAIEATPLSGSTFVLRNLGRARLEFPKDAQGRIIGLTVNPGHWALHACKAP